jgi:hypothetical protein
MAKRNMRRKDDHGDEGEEMKIESVRVDEEEIGGE